LVRNPTTQRQSSFVSDFRGGDSPPAGPVTGVAHSIQSCRGFQCRAIVISPAPAPSERTKEMISGCDRNVAGGKKSSVLPCLSNRRPGAKWERLTNGCFIAKETTAGHRRAYFVSPLRAAAKHRPELPYRRGIIVQTNRNRISSRSRQLTAERRSTPPPKMEGPKVKAI